MASDVQEQLTKYLTDAHSLEEQALAQLRSAPEVAGHPALADAFREHLAETEGHERTIRSLLESRGAKPSTTKDAVMKLGGKGFLLFARFQPDTPGKLLSHALSYEALERASYELLARVADRAADVDAVDAARRIRDEEDRMAERLEGLVDEAVEASLAALGRPDLNEQLRKYLADAHAIEEQAIELLEKGPKLAGDPRLADAYAEHLAETRDHAELVQERLRSLGGDPSTLKDAALRLGALNWAAFFSAHPDTPGKLAAFAHAFEHLEIGGYAQLARVARRADDADTAQLAERILAQEQNAAKRIAGLFDEATAASLATQGVPT